MLKVLFVDDEENVLLGLRRATRSMRHEWEMGFFTSGQAALDHFAEHEVDVLVTDMRMPGMDGAELLHHVKTSSPETARIILSGHSEEEALYRSISSAHQFLAKPCDIEVLKATIEDIRRAQATLGDKQVKELIGRIHELPALPAVYEELMAAAARPESTNKELGGIVSQDVGLTAEILHLVNSAFFGLSRTIESVEHAVGMIGLDVVRAIVAGHGLFGDTSERGLDLQKLSERSQLTAALARKVTAHLGGSLSDGAEAYLAGMVHDVGLLVFEQLPDVEAGLVRQLAEADDLAVERATLGADRYAVGSYLLGLWGFAESTVEAVGHLGGPADGPPGGLSWSLRLARELAVSGRVTPEDLDAAGEGAEALVASLGDELRENGTLCAPVGVGS